LVGRPHGAGAVVEEENVHSTHIYHEIEKRKREMSTFLKILQCYNIFMVTQVPSLDVACN
jgi:hypothetical protein